MNSFEEITCCWILRQQYLLRPSHSLHFLSLPLSYPLFRHWIPSWDLSQLTCPSHFLKIHHPSLISPHPLLQTSLQESALDYRQYLLLWTFILPIISSACHHHPSSSTSSESAPSSESSHRHSLALENSPSSTFYLSHSKLYSSTRLDLHLDHPIHHPLFYCL